MSVAFVLSTYCFAVAFRNAPHPAYVTTIANGNMMLVLLLSILFSYAYREHIVDVQWQAVVGMLLTFIGLSIVVKYSSVSSSFSNIIQSRN